MKIKSVQDVINEVALIKGVAADLKSHMIARMNCMSLF